MDEGGALLQISGGRTFPAEEVVSAETLTLE